MSRKYQILSLLLAVILATATLVYADDDDDEGGDEDTPSSMVGTDCTKCHGDKYDVPEGTTTGQGTGGAITIPSSMVGTDCTQCHGNTYANLIGSTGSTGAASSGSTLYQSYCARCHGALNSSDVKRSSAASITSAINSNDGGMGSLSSLGSTSIAAIATVLASNGGVITVPPVSLPPVTTPPVTAVGDGASLYGVNCATCHGPLTASAKRGATALGIQTAIFNNWGGMGYLSQLTMAQTQSISGVLQQVPSSTTTGSADGVSLYLVTCAGCHGPLSTSTVRGANASSIQSAIFGNWGGMGYLAGLNGIQIMDISAKLAASATAAPGQTQWAYPLATPSFSAASSPAAAGTDGAALYAANCAACHGPLATSTKRMTSAGNTQSAIDGNWGGMGYLSNLTAAQLAAIATALY